MSCGDFSVKEIGSWPYTKKKKCVLLSKMYQLLNEVEVYALELTSSLMR